MSLIWIGTVILIAGVIQQVFGGQQSNKCIHCAYAHKKDGLNYSWLNNEFGNVQKIEFEEPVDTSNMDFQGRPVFRRGEMVGNWKPYTDEIWEIHCKPDVINHSPDKLVEQHVDAFINHKSRFARLRFTLEKDGIVYQMEPTRRFYELERDFFSRHNRICRR